MILFMLEAEITSKSLKKILVSGDRKMTLCKMQSIDDVKATLINELQCKNFNYVV